MILSWADRRLGAIEHDVLPLQGAGTGATPERHGGLHVVRDADQAVASADAAAPVTPTYNHTRGDSALTPCAICAAAAPWWIDPYTGRLWGSAPDYVHRAVKDRQFCEQVRDARAEGRTPLSADEFFSNPRT